MRARRVFAGALALLVCGSLLSGCAFFPKKGQSTEQAAALVGDIDAFSTSNVSVTSNLSGFTTSYYVYTAGTLADGYRVADADAALDWLLRTAWSINDHKPTLINVGVLSGTRVAADWDWVGAMERRGLDFAWIGRFMDDSGALGFRMKDHEALIAELGPWPGEVPMLPEGVFVPAS